MNIGEWLTADQWLRVGLTLGVAGLVIVLGRGVYELFQWARSVPEPEQAWPYEWLEHEGVLYRAPSLEDALSLTRYLSQVDALPETEDAA